MPATAFLGALSSAQQLLVELVRLHSQNRQLNWLLGRSVYQELYFLREQLKGEADLSQRVKHLFGYQVTDAEQAESQLPDPDHLLNWAMEVHEQHLLWLANPRLLTNTDDSKISWTASYLTQLHAQTYESMTNLLGLQQYRQPDSSYRVQEVLTARLTAPESNTVSQGHYRIGAREGVVFDNEQPAQMVELHNFRIQLQPVCNSDYLCFIESGGYQSKGFWSDTGHVWRKQQSAIAPIQWQKDDNGNWYGMSINGAADLPDTDPVRGLSWYEAQAYANWAAANRPGCEGAALPHEYQWEAAVRTQIIDMKSQTLEWCANPFEAYDQYQRPEDPELATREFTGNYLSIRGNGLHTLPALQRGSYRHRGLADSNHLGAGLRLILPPIEE